MFKNIALCKGFDSSKQGLGFASDQGCRWVEGGTAALGTRVQRAGKINILNKKMLFLHQTFKITDMKGNSTNNCDSLS